MDKFDYQVSETEYKQYKSSGLTPGDVKKPVAWGSKSSFSQPMTTAIGDSLMQVIIEPLLDGQVVLSSDHVNIRYLQNGVYNVECLDKATRVVGSTGPVFLAVLFSKDEVNVLIDEVAVEGPLSSEPSTTEVTLVPAGGAIYDKLLVGGVSHVRSLINKKPMTSHGSDGSLSLLSYDKLYDPKLMTIDDMDKVYDYAVACRKLTEANTAVVFYSNTDNIERSDNAEDWRPVNVVELHGEHAPIFRSKDNSFALRFYDTNIDHFLVRGGTTSVTGEIYKIGNNIGSYFSHDSYLIKDGSLTIEAPELTSVSILGLLESDSLADKDFQVDNSYDNPGKMHLYTFSTTTPLTVSGEKMYIAAIGINLIHEDLMNHITGVPQASYADVIEPLKIGQSINGDNEYSILDLQWNI